MGDGMKTGAGMGEGSIGTLLDTNRYSERRTSPIEENYFLSTLFQLLEFPSTSLCDIQYCTALDMVENIRTE
jgi:hypothetical protein